MALPNLDNPTGESQLIVKITEITLDAEVLLINPKLLHLKFAIQSKSSIMWLRS